MSPRKKKIKLEEKTDGKESEMSLKREAEARSPTKRVKVETPDSNANVDIQALKRKNFVTACEQVSYKAYFDFDTRFQMLDSPSCMTAETCNHLDSNKIGNIRQIPDYIEQCIKTELKSYTWYEALELCQLSITPEKYLPADILKEVVEIILNAQENSYADYTLDELIDISQQVLSLSYNMHPPCVMKSLRNLYKDFLTSPLDKKEKTYSNRTQFGYDKGIVKYCMDRLEFELSLESTDEPIVDKDQEMPEELTQSVKGLYWKKEKFEIFEVLERPDRIQRLMAVLESLIELLQYDLGIWHSRYKSNLSSHVMRSHRPLMATVLWSNNVLYTGVVNNICRQIFRLFAHLIHLQYPQEHISIMSTWLTVIIQTFYICENNSNSDYPNVGKYCAAFAKEFYKVIAEMPGETVIRIMEKIYPTFMQHLIGVCHLQSILSTNESNIIKIFIKFLKEKQWKLFPDSQSEIQISKSTIIRPKKVKNFMKYLEKISTLPEDFDEYCEVVYPKLDPETLVSDNVDRNHIVHMLYITIDAYLDAYSIQSVQDTLDDLNDQVQRGIKTTSQFPENTSYSVTEYFIKQYRSIYQNLTELIDVLNTVNRKQIPQIEIFENIGFFSELGS
ncbi:uncharacterized protein LOC126367035 [Pectinophora gossypiella]|nr:uncharacterized protein LOC126367035 [Pectinophora gossypiella]